MTKPLCVAGDLLAQPVGARRGADEDEEPAGLHLTRVPGVPVGQGEALEVAVSGCRHDLGARCTSMLGEARMRSTRYSDMVSSSVGAANDQVHARGEAGQVERGLACGVGCADDVDLVASALGRLARRWRRSRPRAR